MPGPPPDTVREMFDLAPTQGPLSALHGEHPAAPQWFTDTVAMIPQSSFVEVEGARIHYLRWGDKARPGLLLVHGNAAHAYWWSFIAPFLARDYNVAAMDLSGMGDSRMARPTYAMEIFAREQLAVCEDAGMFVQAEPPIIVAHSFGGFVTMLTGALYGDRLAGTVIVDLPVNPPGRPGGPPRTRDQAAQYLSNLGRRARPLPADAAPDLRKPLSRRLGGAAFA